MTQSIAPGESQLHPLEVALKRSWERLVVNRDVKQDWLAARVGVNKSAISRWKNPEESDFPNREHMCRFIEALQEWPGIERWEPLEAFNEYFGCHTSTIRRIHYPIQALLGLLALDEGKVMNAALNGDQEATAQVMHHLRRIVDDLDDELTPGGRP